MRPWCWNRGSRVGIVALAPLLIVLVLSLRALAQVPEPTIESASLQIWPEYDDPGLLVLFSGHFTDTLEFPREVAFPLPQGARDIQATVQDPQRGLLSQQWKIENNQLIYTLPGPDFHIEYYLDRPPSGDQRELSYTFQAPYRIQALDAAVQQPDRSTDFSMSPAPEGSHVDNSGLTYHTFKRSGLEAGDRLDLTIRYKKTDQAVSRPRQAPSDSPQSTQSSVTASKEAKPAGTWVPWLLIGLGAIGLAGAVSYWFIRRRGTPAPQPVARAARPSSSDTARSKSGLPAHVEMGQSASYCTQCGRQFAPDERFCANCGAPRRG